MQPAELCRDAHRVAGGDLHFGGDAGDGEAVGAGILFLILDTMISTEARFFHQYATSTNPMVRQLIRTTK